MSECSVRMGHKTHVLRPPVMDLHVNYLLESEYNISFNPKFYYTSVTRELLTICLSFSFFFLFHRSNLTLSLSFSQYFLFFIFLQWQLGSGFWVWFKCSSGVWCGFDGNFVLEVKSLADVVESRPLGVFWVSLWRTWGFSFWFSWLPNTKWRWKFF